MAGVATSAYVRLCARPLLMGLLSVDLLWAFLTLTHITLDLLDLFSSAIPVIPIVFKDSFVP